MLYRPLGKTGLKVSVMGLGGHIFPAWPGNYYEGFYGRRFVEGEALEARRAAVEAAVEGGVNLFSVDFDFEAKALGRIMSELGIRDQALITAVVDFKPENYGPGDWAALENSIDRLLRLLRSERLELPQIRISSRFLNHGFMEELVYFLYALEDKGKIACPVFYSGDDDLAVLLTGVRLGWFQVVARAFGFLNPTAMNELLPLVYTVGAGFIGLVPFQKGWLFDCGAEAGLSSAKTACLGMSWALSQPGATTMLCGVSGPEDVKENLAAVNTSPGAFSSTDMDSLITTETYDRFLDQVKNAAPYLVHDWRQSKEIRS